jgi:hypothetical protein
MFTGNLQRQWLYNITFKRLKFTKLCNWLRNILSNHVWTCEEYKLCFNQILMIILPIYLNNVMFVVFPDILPSWIFVYFYAYVFLFNVFKVSMVQSDCSEVVYWACALIHWCRTITWYSLYATVDCKSIIIKQNRIHTAHVL